MKDLSRLLGDLFAFVAFAAFVGMVFFGLGEKPLSSPTAGSSVFFYIGVAAIVLAIWMYARHNRLNPTRLHEDGFDGPDLNVVTSFDQRRHRRLFTDDHGDEFAKRIGSPSPDQIADFGDPRTPDFRGTSK